MKKLFHRIFLILLYLPMLVCVLSVTSSKILAAEAVRSFHLEATVNTDGTVNCRETIVYDFDSLSKHGYYRQIPLTKTNDQGKKFVMEFNLQNITDENGATLIYDDQSTATLAYLKIGDPNKTVTGVKTYIIEYQLKGALSYFSDHDEFSWNVTGFDWQIDLETVSAAVYLPAGILLTDTNTICYTGVSKSKASECNMLKENNELTFSADQAVLSGENLTIVVGFPKGIVAELNPQPAPTGISSVVSLIGLIPLLALFLFYFLVPLVLIVIIIAKGKDPKVNKGPTAWFDPPKHNDNSKMLPAEVGLLTDKSVDPRDISATIISLAIRGFLRIEEIPEKKETYQFVQLTAKPSEQLTTFEKLLYDGIFTAQKTTVDVNSLKDKFYLSVNAVKKELYQSMTQREYFIKNPQSVRNLYLGLAVVSCCLFNFILGIVLFVMSRVMPRFSLLGAEKKEEALALKRFLQSQERQLEFQEKNWFFFEKLLPYAVAFGVAKEWAKKFESIQIPPELNWYRGNQMNNLTTFLFINSLTHMTHATESITSLPYSSSRSSMGFSSGFGGGGFSGGGGGGGGGGSW